VEYVADDPVVVLHCGATAELGVCDIGSRFYLQYRQQHCLPRNACYRLVMYSPGLTGTGVYASFDGGMFHERGFASSTSVYFGNECHAQFDDVPGSSSVIEMFSGDTGRSVPQIPIYYQVISFAQILLFNGEEWLSQRYNSSLFRYTSFQVPTGSCVSIDPLDADGGSCRVSLDGVVYRSNYNCSDARTLVGTGCYSALPLVCDDFFEQQALVEIQTTVTALSGLQYNPPYWALTTLQKAGTEDAGQSYPYDQVHTQYSSFPELVVTSIMYRSPSDYVDFFCVPRNSCTQLMLFSPLGANTVARVNGISNEQYKECITVDGYKCYYQMTRLVETIDCPLTAWREKTTSSRSIWTALTVVIGLTVGLLIGWLVQLFWSHCISKQQEQQQQSGESRRQQPTG
jgi:hypothetical protein